MADLESPPLGGFCGGYGLGWVSKFEVRARPLGLQTGTGPRRATGCERRNVASRAQRAATAATFFRSHPVSLGS